MLRQVLAALLVLLLARVAHAEEPEEAPRSTFRVGPTLAYFEGAELAIDGRAQASEDPIGYGLSVAYRLRLLRWLALEAGGGIGRYSTDWSRQTDQSRTRAQLTLGPVFVGTMYRARGGAPRRAKPSRVDYHLRIPLGLSAAWFSDESSRAVDAYYDSGIGFTCGLVAGAEMFWERHGAYAELGLVGSTLRLTRHSTLRADPTVGASETYRYSHLGFVFGWGYAFRF